jgi:hypothetical protein
VGVSVDVFSARAAFPAVVPFGYFLKKDATSLPRDKVLISTGERPVLDR